MKTITISLDELDLALAHLWEQCQQRDCTLDCSPSFNTILIKDLNEKAIAEIIVTNIVDAASIKHYIWG